MRRIASSSLANLGADAMRFSTGPEVKWKIDAGGGKSFEPFAPERT
jgi:hypothetical protein